MFDQPRLRIELEGVKRSIIHCFNQNNDELNQRVIQTIDRQLKEEWVTAKIDEAVKDCINKAINEVSSNDRLQSAISGMISDSIAKLIEGSDKD